MDFLRVERAAVVFHANEQNAVGPVHDMHVDTVCFPAVEAVLHDVSGHFLNAESGPHGAAFVDAVTPAEPDNPFRKVHHVRHIGNREVDAVFFGRAKAVRQHEQVGQRARKSLPIQHRIAENDEHRQDSACNVREPNAVHSEAWNKKVTEQNHAEQTVYKGQQIDDSHTAQTLVIAAEDAANARKRHGQRKQEKTGPRHVVQASVRGLEEESCGRRRKQQKYGCCQADERGSFEQRGPHQCFQSGPVFLAGVNARQHAHRRGNAAGNGPVQAAEGIDGRKSGNAVISDKDQHNRIQDDGADGLSQLIDGTGKSDQDDGRKLPGLKSLPNEVQGRRMAKIIGQQNQKEDQVADGCRKSQSEHAHMENGYKYNIEGNVENNHGAHPDIGPNFLPFHLQKGRQLRYKQKGKDAEGIAVNIVAQCGEQGCVMHKKRRNRPAEKQAGQRCRQAEQKQKAEIRRKDGVGFLQLIFADVTAAQDLRPAEENGVDRIQRPDNGQEKRNGGKRCGADKIGRNRPVDNAVDACHGNHDDLHWQQGKKCFFNNGFRLHSLFSSNPPDN